MQGNDLAETLTSRVAVFFEGLIKLEPHAPTDQVKQRRWHRKTVDVADLTLDQQVRRWRPLELPLKSLLHMINQLGVNVDVYTFYPVEYVDAIEQWLFRKGVSVQVYSYENVEALRDDFKFDREITTLYTPFESDAAWLGPRCTVMHPEHTWGF